jgi:hypothetical protein
MQIRRNATIGVNPIAAKNNTIVTLHLHDDTLGFHRVPPHVVMRQVSLHELVVLPSELLEDRVWHQFDDSTTINEHHEGRIPIIGTSSAEGPIVQALASRMGSKAVDDNFTDYDPDLLNFNAVESEIICQMSSRL